MPLSKLQFRPGINREGTNYSNEGSWYDGDKIRFRNGYPERIGGWTKQSNQFEGTARFTHDFITLSGLSYLFLGSEKKAYLEESGTFYDITPFRRTVLFPIEVTGVFASTVVGNAGVPFILGDYEISVEGTGAVGDVTVTHNAVRIDQEGLEATAITDGVDSVTNSEGSGLQATGQIGQVTFFNGIITFQGPLTVSDTNAKKATGYIGTVTVETEDNG